MTQLDMSIEQKRSMSTVRKHARRPDFPPAKRVIGRTKFYSRIAAREYWSGLIDGRSKQQPPKRERRSGPQRK